MVWHGMALLTEAHIELPFAVYPLCAPLRCVGTMRLRAAQQSTVRPSTLKHSRIDEERTSQGQRRRRRTW